MLQIKIKIMDPKEKFHEIIEASFHETQGMPEYITGHKQDVINLALHFGFNELAKQLKSDLI